MTEFIPKILPLNQTIETTKVLKKTISANRALAKLNGVAKIIPNQAKEVQILKMHRLEQ